MTRVKIADCFELKQEANFSETYLTEECLQKKYSNPLLLLLVD
ncbi:hypothetical protein B188_14700 [Candidatus Brocadiaceae bacterium B188]|nr:hypothetical protein B188_14700 [Candidatus Brocadiaceae bacterium B188]